MNQKKTSNMTQEEALERIKVRFDKWALDDEDMKAIQTLIPELRDSKDERIRKELIKYHKQQFEKNRDQEVGLFHKDAIAWLEKQEIFSKNGAGCYYYDADGSYTFIGSLGFGPIEDIKINGERPKTENKSVSVDLPGACLCVEKQKEPHKRLRDKTPWIVTAKEELAHTEERLQANLEELHRIRAEKEKQKESLGDFIDDFPYSDEQKEQKPNYCHYGGDPSVERCKYCSAACSARLTEEQKPKAKAKSPLSPHELYDAKIEGISQGRQDVLDHPEQFGLQKPAEWSEEDENNIGWIVAFFQGEEGSGEVIELMRESLISWLKSLRPQYHGDVTMTEAYKMGLEAGKASSWKPSEEHLSALLAVFNDPNNIGSQTCQLALTDLYEQLKKL